MAAWGATEAKAKFSELLDRAETEGPQVVKRRKTEFFVMTQAQMAAVSDSAKVGKPFVSAWDALRPSSNLSVDVEFPRHRGKASVVKF